MSDEVKVTQPEILLYGGNAGMIRLVGQATATLARATDEAYGAMSRSTDADQVSAGLTNPPVLPSESTRWTTSVWERLSAVQMQLAEVYRDIAGETMEWWKKLGTMEPDAGKHEPLTEDSLAQAITGLRTSEPPELVVANNLAMRAMELVSTGPVTRVMGWRVDDAYEKGQWSVRTRDVGWESGVRVTGATGFGPVGPGEEFPDIDRR